MDDKHNILTKDYEVDNHQITMIENLGKPWALWSSLKAICNFPSVASLPVISETIKGGLGNNMVKGKALKTDGAPCQCWMLNLEAIRKIILIRFEDEAPAILARIAARFDLFQDEIDKKNKELPVSGGSEPETIGSETTSSTSPQAESQGKDEDSPELEDYYPETMKELCDRFDKSMGSLVINMAKNFETRIQELEMVKYADQLGDMAERISNMEEQLHEYKAEMKDFHLLIRSLKEATGSQKQTEIIGQLVHMVTHMHPEHFKV